jgi:ubiquinone/menaquinone biosynthesis C-methylase UbiE
MEEHLKGMEEFFDHYSSHVARWRTRNSGYHRAIAALARFYVPPGARVLEVGSGTGDLLAAMNPPRRRRGHFG